ncbi:hypothetical protein EJ04DRAFT_297522 [Polyplosphaeria fusca]|uniref:Uncharacterized protein n=1 Tax=Polyplosphaeria fusca TaxID=682080 RepID=A0A9P4QXX9_9PLEO|nr:hypothetical protein EJ04DRAFT_297522 [Polyplosphaeria fusca]
MALTYYHLGDVKWIPADAPPALQFLQSFVPAFDGSSHGTRLAHCSPTATYTCNNFGPLRISYMNKSFELRDSVARSVLHVVNQVWILTEPDDKITLLLDSTLTIPFKGANKSSILEGFTAMKLSKPDDAGKGAHGLWIDSIEISMDLGPLNPMWDMIMDRALDMARQAGYYFA